MKKIPTLFVRPYLAEGNHTVAPIVTPGLEWVLAGEGVATLKWDGTAVYYDGTSWYKRYDAKKGKKPPEGSIPCQEAPDPSTSHWPHWAPISWNDNSDTYIKEAIKNSSYDGLEPYYNVYHYGFEPYYGVGTYEAIGPKIQGNPYALQSHILRKHGALQIPDFPRDFDGMREYLKHHYMEGVVFWKDGEPQCKIKRTDFGFDWPVKEDK